MALLPIALLSSLDRWKWLPIFDVHLLRHLLDSLFLCYSKQSQNWEWLCACHYLGIPTLAVEGIVRLLGEVEFVRIQGTGNSIKGVLPTVPYYDDLYNRLGECATEERTLNETEQLALHPVDRSAKAPDKIDALRNSTGADKRVLRESWTDTPSHRTYWDSELTGHAAHTVIGCRNRSLVVCVNVLVNQLLRRANDNENRACCLVGVRP